jgi:hypothetical protein
MPGRKAGHFRVRMEIRVTVMAGLVPAIHVWFSDARRKTWMAGMNPAMTTG